MRSYAGLHVKVDVSAPSLSLCSPPPLTHSRCDVAIMMCFFTQVTWYISTCLGSVGPLLGLALVEVSVDARNPLRPSIVVIYRQRAEE